MSTKIGLRWKIYFFLFIAMAIHNLLGLLDPPSTAYIYYHVLVTFDKNYSLSYLLNLASAILTVASIIPLFLYVFQIRLFGKRLWQGLFLMRALFDIIGHPYELKLIESVFRMNVWYALGSLSLLLVLTIPSYVALYQYAFEQDKLSGLKA